MTDAILFKHEDGDFGPVYVRRGGEVFNYEDHESLRSPVTGMPIAKWFSLRKAEEIAEREGLPLEAW